ncbi:restriction endonuclease subunit S [Streptomyces rubiginosohelvolus]|uniref:restriction endonuclease subunit S n=1 Tax=Streptomyces rubiginosohelvolus TaxID=67362 RepID=UPI003F91CDEA
MDLPQGWAWARLDEIVEVLDHQRVPVSATERAQRPGGVPYYGATGQVGWIDTALFNEELVLLGEDGVKFFDGRKTKAYRISGPSWVNNHAHVLRVREGVTLSRFVVHYLNSFNYEGYVNGTTRLKLTKSSMASIPVPLPPLAEQHRIVEALESHLSRLDAGVAGMALAQAKAQSFTSVLYGRAVSGGLSRPVRPDEAVDEAVIQEASSSLAARRWKAVPCLNIPGYTPPDNWTTVSLGTLSHASGYGTSTKCGYDAPGYPVLRIPNVQGGSIDLSDVKNAMDSSLDLRKLSLGPGDLLFVRTNGSPSLIGRVGVVEKSLPYAFASYLIRFRLTPGTVEPRWVKLVTQSPLWRRVIERYAASSAGQYNLSAETLSQLPVPIPPLNVQRETLEAVDAATTGAIRLSAAIDVALRQSGCLRSALLQRAFTGCLVSQDPADETASVLLDRIRAAREAQRGKLRAVRRPRKAAATADAPPPPPASSTPSSANAVQQELPL